MSASNEERVQFNSGDLRLEGVLHRTAEPAFVALVLHPHPSYGGDMDNHVVTELCDAMSALGATTLRFNFRGAGASEGQHDNGGGERDDALNAIKLLREIAPAAPLVAAGYSFGAMVAASIVADARPDALILVSLPATSAAGPNIPDDVPTLILTGSADQVAPPAALHRLESARHPLIVIEGADHSWWDRTGELDDAVTRFLGSQVVRT